MGYYQRCLEINPAEIEGHCGQMRLHILKQEFGLARQEYALAEAVDADSIFPKVLHAQIDFFGGDYGAAEADYRELVRLDRGGLVGYHGGISYLSALAYLRLRAGDAACIQFGSTTWLPDLIVGLKPCVPRRSLSRSSMACVNMSPGYASRRSGFARNPSASRTMRCVRPRTSFLVRVE